MSNLMTSTNLLEKAGQFL
ncbi:hypothetical protein RDABS01_017736 [Bienertia sinuspersici]